MKTKIKYKLKIILVISYMIFIYLFSEYKFPISEPGEGGPSFNIFPLLHICEFGLLSLLLMFAFYDKDYMEFIISISILYAFFDEFHQYFVPYRYFDILDIFHNIVGSTLGIIGYFVLLLIYSYLYINLKYRYVGKRKNMYIDAIGYSW